MDGKSKIFESRGSRRIREVTRRLVNRKFMAIGENKDEKIILKELWEAIYYNIRSNIWLKRCKKIKEIKENLGYKVGKKSNNDNNDNEIEPIEKRKCNSEIDTQLIQRKRKRI